MATVTAVVEWDAETALYVATVPGVNGAHTQAASLDELRENLREVLALLVEAGRFDPGQIPQFIGLQQVDVAV